jgi:DNA-binding NarL/FixJ family response regulator
MITAVVATETRLLRHLLSEALGERFGIVVAATAPSAPRALALSEGLHPDVVIVSMRMPDAVGLVRALLERRTRVVTLGACDEEPVAVVDDGTLHDLVAAIHGAMQGAFSNAPVSGPDLDQLTPTERRVLHAVNEGWSNKEIARELGVAVPTVKHHVHSFLTKLGVRRRGEAAALFRRTSSPPAFHSRAATPRIERSTPADSR